MAANRQQGGYLAAFLVASTAIPAGALTLSSSTVLGGIVLLGGIGLMVFSLFVFMKIKPLEFLDE
jgi:hypothetical protein